MLSNQFGGGDEQSTNIEPQPQQDNPSTDYPHIETTTRIEKSEPPGSYNTKDNSKGSSSSE